MQQNILLQLIRRKAKRKSLIQPGFDANRSIFVHVPRVAGTSLKKALFPEARTLTHYRAIDYFLDSPLKYRRYFVFAFVRNPYDRLVSAYEFLMRGGKNDADKRFRDRVLRSYATFADLVKQGLGRSEIEKKYHFMPQHRFIVGPWGSIMVDFLGRFERIEADFATISSRIGLDARLPHTNESKRVNFEDYYTEELRSIVYRHYKTDFDLLGYDPAMSAEGRPVAHQPR
jgi:chondroitin 4-sulfotransferase 11